MKIVIATPLYPPEIGAAAAYIKELAVRLSATDVITVLAYTHLPERVPGVHLHVIDKRRPLPLRLLAYTLALWKLSRNADIVYAENGASVELPVGLVARLRSTPMVLHIGDPGAHARAAETRWLKSLEQFAIRAARHVISEIPPKRPEILPYAPKPEREMAAYEASWKHHILLLKATFSHDH